MELRQLRYLVALAEERSFTGAARAANVAQPALSRQIQKLEQELAVPLVDRTTRRMSLTPAGQETVEAGRRILGEIEALTNSLSQTKSLLQGVVTVGITQTEGPLHFPELLAAFSREHSGVELTVREGLSLDLASWLREDRLDLALISDIPQRERHQLEFQPLHNEPLVALLPGDHPLATRLQLSLDELRDQRFVTFPPGATIRDTVEHAAMQSGFTPRVAIETNGVSRMAALVGQGLGVAILPLSDARHGWPNTAAVAMRAPTLYYEVFLAWRTNRQLSPAAEAFRTAIVDAAAQTA